MLHVFTKKEINKFINLRQGEIKLGEVVSVLNSDEDIFKEIKNQSSKYVIIGVPEDIGVKMNKGKAGAETAFFPSIKALLNTQENQFITGKDILVLGYFDFFKIVKNFKNDDAEKGDYLVKHIDKELSELIQFIVSIDKIPIIIGGGHNNAYGNIKGASIAKNQKINVVNIDAHSDLRKLEVRHSGNGFSYALNDGFLDNYFIFGLHENYTPQYIFDFIHKNINIDYNTFEELFIYKSTKLETELKRALNFVNKKAFGIEIDLDCIKYFPSSAMTPTGLSPYYVRQFVNFLAKDTNAIYLHICEGSPILSNLSNSDEQVGKFISYLITDFIKTKY